MSNETTASSVTVTEVSKVFNSGKANQVDALHDVSLVVKPGEFVSLIGPSGCGKSTLLRLIADLTQPSSGSIAINGKPAKQARLDQDYGMAFQQAGLFDWRKVARRATSKQWDAAAVFLPFRRQSGFRWLL